ncbi:MAG: serine hydrolase domain-containing protein [candidate division WOR-3 bacterium]|jgi:CubicO group peptidase (beta-lactamase class C family)
MRHKFDKSGLDKLTDDVIKQKYIYGTVFYVATDDQSIDLISAGGNMQEDSQYYIASINKLFISAIILRLHTEKRLDLYDKISKYLPKDVISGLHVYNGKDYSYDLSVLHLISQTSGLPGYLIDKQPNGKKIMNELEAGIDQAWPIDKVIDTVKIMQPHFPPGQKGKAKYIDTNHQILSRIIELITGNPINIVLNSMFQELNLTQTYVCEDVNDQNFVPIRYKEEVIRLPLFLTSTKNDIISTARDQMTFLKAFFNGHFFPKDRLHDLEKWNNVFFPFKYGIGLQKFRLPRILSPFKPVPDMIGHSGSTGSVAFYIPDKGVYITGTVNQQARPNVAFQTMIKIVNHFKRGQADSCYEIQSRTSRKRVRSGK